MERKKPSNERKESNTMNPDSYIRMVEEGTDVISILNSVPKDKRLFATAIAEAFLDGMIVQQRLTQEERKRRREAHEKHLAERGITPEEERKMLLRIREKIVKSLEEKPTGQDSD